MLEWALNDPFFPRLVHSDRLPVPSHRSQELYDSPHNTTLFVAGVFPTCPRILDGTIPFRTV